MADGPDFASLAMQHKASSGGGGGDNKEDPFQAAVAVIQKLGAGNIPLVGQYLKADGDFLKSISHESYLLPDTQGFFPMEGKDMLGIVSMIKKYIVRDFHAQTDGIQIAHVDTNIQISPPSGFGHGGGHGGGGHDITG